MNKSALNTSILKPALTGLGIGFGVPMSLYTAGKLAEIASKMGDINDSTDELKSSILPMAFGASLLGGAGGGYATNKYMNRPKPEEEYPEYDTTGMIDLSKYNSYKAEFIDALIKSSGLNNVGKLGIGLAAGIPAAIATGYYGKDLVDKATGGIDKELGMGKLKLDAAQMGVPLLAALLGAGAGAATTYAVDKYSSYKDAYKELIKKELNNF